MNDEAFQEAISAFVARLEELGEPDLYDLRPAASEAQIASAEETLSCHLPPSFRAFLLAHNGGSAWETSLYGVGCESEDEDEDHYDLAVLNLRGRQEGLPDHLIGFGATLNGDVWCFDVSESDEPGDESPVVLIDVLQGQVIPAASGFVTFLARLPDLEQELAEQRGPHPMTVEEWEEFLTRERAKLRKLSQTPAKQLRMPDPEEVRAELAGKIPVDPRHLKPKT
ncbi:MAG: SMI1/KNR4 family protein [Planctomycetes bacterium]|nr:SMI1/KNR4 family protein [Planctomycetota bacterium]